MSKYKFWKWLFLLSRKNLRAAHMGKHFNDIKCDNCQEWFSISGVDHNHAYTNKSFSEGNEGYSCKCGQCDHVSFWSATIAPFLLRVDESGNPV